MVIPFTCVMARSQKFTIKQATVMDWKNVLLKLKQQILQQQKRNTDGNVSIVINNPNDNTDNEAYY